MRLRCDVKVRRTMCLCRRLADTRVQSWCCCCAQQLWRCAEHTCMGGKGARLTRLLQQGARSGAGTSLTADEDVGYLWAARCVWCGPCCAVQQVHVGLVELGRAGRQGRSSARVD